MSSYTVSDGQSQTLSFINTNRAPQTDTINVSGTAAIDLSIPGGSNESVAVALAPNAHLTAGFHFVGQETVDVGSDGSATLTFTGTSDFAAADPARFNVDASGSATINVGQGGELEFVRSVGSGITVNLGYSSDLNLDQPAAFKGAVNASDAAVHLLGLTQATDYDLTNGVLTIYGGSNDQPIDSLRLSDTSPQPAGFSVTLNANGVNVVEQGSPETISGTALPQHVAPPPPPPATPQYVAVHDTTTNADLPDTSTAYTGPVAGIASQFIAITPDSLNVTAKADGMFIKTNGGNDAVALHAGTNVVDAGTGSNFLTSGGGFDTFFLDARNIPAAASAAGPVPGAIWDTIQNFGHGDAATIFGIGPGTALVWQKNEGAAGHSGLTLHADLASGAEASLTLAGIDSKAGLSLSYGSTGGASYLYIKAA